MKKHKGKNINEIAPHIFAIGDVAYRAMINEQKNNSVLVSGESGAGKTEATKLLMRYLAFIGGTSGSGERTVEQKVLESNPILEAFGNSKTVRNNNSSRFGKFVEIQFNDRGKISGAAVKTYLLEKSRVCQIGSPERSYHIFYFLCASPPEHRERFKVGDPQQFNYLNQSDCLKVDSIDDLQEYLDMRSAMDVVGMNEEEQDGIFRIVAAILHLGNINFSKGKEPDSSQIKDDQSRFHLNTAAELLRVDVGKLEKAMIYKRIVTREGSIDKELDPNSAVVSRDGLAKTIYSRLFDWLVLKINVSIGQDPNSKMLIGVLDIYGFESFKTNSFEQLCINLTNEKLQQHFNQHVFKMEQEEYNKEEIDWSYIEFSDNQDVLDLIEKKPNGVLALLDESCMLPRATHETFASNLYNKFKTHKRFSKPKLSRTAFTISHFAGDVVYQSEQFLDKNKDYVVPEQNELLNESQCPFVSNLFPITEASKSAKFNSIGTRFKLQLNSLMDTLNATEPHYVRCVKPNNVLKPMIFQNSSILQQLQCGGVLEAIRISCLGFPTRRTFAEFLKRFTVLGPSLIDGVEEKEACRKILDKYGLTRYQIGKTKVFLRAGQMAELDARRTEVLGRAATKTQRKWKTYYKRKNFLHLREVSAVVQAACRAKLARDLHERMRRLDASIKIQKYWRRYTNRKSYKNLVSKTITIQTGLRALSAHLALVDKLRNRAATHIQAKWRCHINYMAHKHLKKATITSQSWRRWVLAKRELGRLREIAKEKARLEEERRKKLEEEERERARLEAERMASMAEEERLREIEEAARRKKQEEEERQRAAEEAERRKIQEEEERQRAAEEAERLKILEEEERQRAAEEAERQKALEAERQKQLEEEERIRAIEEAERQKALAEEERLRAIEEAERQKALAEEERRKAIEEAEKQKALAEEEKRRAIEEAEKQKALAEEEKRRAIEEAERQKALAEEEMRRALEEAARQQALEAERQKALAEAMEKQGAEMDQLQAKFDEASQENESLKKELAELQEKVGEANKEIVNGLQENIRRLEQDKATKEEMLQTKETLLQTERQEHDVTRRRLSDSQEKNEELTKKFQGADKKIDELQIESKRYQEEADAKEVMLQREKQEHKATQEELIDSQAKNKKLTRDVDDANDTADRLQRNINRFEEIIASNEILIEAERQEHEGTRKLLKESYEKNEELMDKIKEANKRADRIQEQVERVEETLSSKESLLQVEKEEHQETKKLIKKYKEQIEDLEEKLKDTNKKLNRHQDNVERLEETISSKETTVQAERQEHDRTKKFLKDFKEQNDELTEQVQTANKKVDRLQYDLERLEEAKSSKDTLLQKKQQELDRTTNLLSESLETTNKLDGKIKDANKRFDELQSEIKRLEENILLKETLLQTERQEHDGTKKLLKESREKNEEIMDKMKEVDKRSDRLQDNLTRLEESISAKESSLQIERQENEETKKILKKLKDQNEELEEKIKEANKKIDRHQATVERLEETISSKEEQVQSERQEHDATKKILRESRLKVEELSDTVRDADKKFDRLQDKIERLEDAVNSKDTMLQNERQENVATKKLLKESQQESEELEKKVRDASKKTNRLQDNAERLEESITLKESLLQKERQEHEVTKRSIKALQEDNEALVQKNKEANKIIDQLQEGVKRLEEFKASTEAILQTERQGHDAAKKLLTESQKKTEELEQKSKDSNDRTVQLQEDVKRLEDSLAAKDDVLQTERQEHDVTRRSLKRSQDEYKELMKQMEEDRERINEIQNDMQRLKESEIGKETQWQTEKREHDATKRELVETKEKMKELSQKAESIDERIGQLQLELKRLGEEVIAKDASVQIEKREHEATQRALAQAKEYSEELLKRNEASSSRIDKLQEDMARFEERAKEMQEQMLKGKLEIYDARKQVADAELRNKELLQKIQLADKKISQLHDALKRIEENARQREIMLQTEKQQHDKTKNSLSSANGKIQQLERHIGQFQEGVKRYEQDVNAKIQSEKQQHDATKRALSDSQRKNQELQQKVQFSKSTIEQLHETNRRFEEKALNLEQENNSICQTGAKLPPNLRRMGSQISQRMSESFNGYNAPESPYHAPRAPMSTTPRGDFYSEDDREQNAFNEQQQQENQEVLLMRSISQYLGFQNGTPIAANFIYKCLVNWKSFEADRTGVFEHLIQKISSATEDQDNNETLAYWISILSTLVPLLQKIHRTSGVPAGPTPVRRRRMSRTSSSMSGFVTNFGGASGSGANFIQQLVMLLEKLLATIRDNLKNELSSLLGIQAPKVSRMSSMKGLGQALGSATGQWQQIVRILDNYMTILKSNYVPSYIIQRFFTHLFQIMDTQLFNSLLLRRESCSFSNGEFIKAGLRELESWCRDSTEVNVGAAWKELKHIRQAVEFLVALQKQSKTLPDITNDICPSLTTQQLHRLSTLYCDDKYGTNILSQHVTSEINQMMAREPKSSFMLTEGSSPPLTLDELSRSITVYEMRDSDLPISIRNHPGFAFLQQRHY